jgi:hypothetical protein
MAAFLKNTNSMRRFRKTRRGGEGILDSVTQGLTGLTQGLTGKASDATNSVNTGVSSLTDGLSSAKDSFLGLFGKKQAQLPPGATELSVDQSLTTPQAPQGQVIGGRRRSRRRKSRKSRRR